MSIREQRTELSKNSQIDTVSIDQSIVSVFPNPFHDELIISSTQGLESILRIDLYDATGRSVWNTSQIENNTTDAILRIPKLTNGIYTIKVVSNSRIVLIQKLIRN